MINEPMNPFEEEIKANEQEAMTIEVDPYAYTGAVQQEEMKGWRQRLIDNHTKRQEDNKKRVRNAQILGIGKALGDMIGAIWGGVASSRNNAPAVVPAPQASKTAEQVERLIQEGVVSAQDYDKMMLNLSMQEGKDKIALAKAYDELGIKQAQLAEQREYEQQKLAEQREYEQQKLKDAHERQKELIGLRHTNTITQLRKRGENAVAVAQARATENGAGRKKNYSQADLAIIGAALPEFVEETTAKPNKYGELETATKKKPYKPTDNDMEIELARQKERMKHYKLDPNSEDDKARWATIVLAEKALIAALPNVEPEKIMAALLAGYTGEEVLAHFKK